ncbi:MAG: hypothetical protein ACK44R_00585, partial [Burkholderiales bacterium]
LQFLLLAGRVSQLRFDSHQRETDEIVKWNWLAIEYPPNPNAKLIHYTLGTPCFSEYSHTEMSDIWHSAFESTLSGYKKS